jgi:GMP synthase (glutamine-hydrolysing)
MTTSTAKTVLSLDLEPRLDLPPFRGPHLVPAGTALTIVKADVDGVPPSAAPFSHVILSGSTRSIVDDHPTCTQAMALVRDAVARGVPVMGVCYGHQLLARAVLGDAHVRRADVPEFGWLAIRWDGAGTQWFRGLPNPFRVFVGHFDEVVELPPDWRVIARSDGCPIHAFVSERLRLFGVQFHPEMDLDTGNFCFAADKPALAAAGADADRIIAEAVDDGSGPVLFRRFLEWRWDGCPA